MGFRFRRSLGIIPGVRLNFGKRGVSMSVGPRGAKMTIGPSGTRATVGIPGTGMSYTEKLGVHHAAASSPGIAEEEQIQPQPYATSSEPSSSFAALGWIVAAVLLVLLIIAVM